MNNLTLKMYGTDATEQNVRHRLYRANCKALQLQKIIKIVFSVDYGMQSAQERTELQKEAFQCDALDILRDIQQFTVTELS